MDQRLEPRHDRFAEIMAEMRTATVDLAEAVGRMAAESIRDVAPAPLDRPAIEAAFRVCNDAKEDQ